MIHLVTGGARAGKSRLVVDEAERCGGARLVFLATAEARDEEMRARIAAHRDERGERWTTVEEPIHVAAALGALDADAVVLDCLTLWIANRMFAGTGTSDAEVRDAIDSLCDALAALRVPAWVVTNEVGLGIVPGDPVSRRYRDLLGRCNQRVAAVADRVTFMVSGLPLRVK